MTHAHTHTARSATHYGAENDLGPNITYPRPSGLGGFLVWLPALFILIGMPVLALVTTKYVVIPTMKQAYAQEAAMNGDIPNQATAPVFLAKIPIGTDGIGNHNGFRSIALVGANSAFVDQINQSKAKLAELAARDLEGKAVYDLEKPGVLDGLRAQLLTDFNRALGGPIVKEVYIAIWPPK